MNNNQNFQNSINELGDGIVDSAAGALKQVFGGACTLVGGTQKALSNSLKVVNSGINDMAIPTVERLRNIGIDTGIHHHQPTKHYNYQYFHITPRIILFLNSLLLKL